MIARWNGNGFDEPEELLSGVDAFGPISYARDTNQNEYLIWTSDLDLNAETYFDREVIVSHRSPNGTWVTEQLTNDAINDTAVVVLPFQTGLTVYYISCNESPEVSVSSMMAKTFDPDTSTWSDAELQFASGVILNPTFAYDNSNLYCTWSDAAGSGKGVYYSYYNAVDQVWTAPQVLPTKGMASSAQCAFSNGKLQMSYLSERKVTTEQYGYTNTEILYDLRFVEHISHTNLKITSGDVTFDVEKPAFDQPVIISAVVHASGEQDQPGVQVVFYDGDPNTGGIPIVTVPIDVYVGTDSIATASWIYPHDGQKHNIWVVVDPTDAIDEFDETDNSACKMAGVIRVEATYPKVISFSDNSVILQVGIINTGTITVLNVPYKLQLVDEDGAVVKDIHSGIIPSIDPGQMRTEDVIWDVTTENLGIYAIKIVVDPVNEANPNGTLGEIDRIDHEAALIVSVLPDLAIDPASISYKIVFDDYGYSPKAFVTYTVWNYGAKSNAVLCPVYLQMANNVSFWVDDIPTISPGQSLTRTFEIDLSGIQGAEHYGINVNPSTIDSWGRLQHTIDESTYKNNTADIVLPGPPA
jgi:hypothetical protein